MLCIALLLVLTAAWSVELAEKRVRMTAQQAMVDDIAAALERQAASDSAYLAALASLMNDGDLTPEVVREHVGQLRGIGDLKGAIGLGWIDRASTDAPLGFTPLNVDMIALYNGVPGAAGASELQNRDFLSSVISHLGKPGKVVTIAVPSGAGAASPRFMLAVPVPDRTAESGFRAAAFLLFSKPDFAAAAIDPKRLQHGRIALIDRAQSGGKAIYETGATEGATAAPLDKSVRVFDQIWTVHFEPTAHVGPTSLTLVIVFGGAAFSLLLFAYVVLVQRRSRDLEILIDSQMTQERERAAFIRELNHRVKNTLANVTSIISLTRNRATDVQTFADLLLERVKALAASHSLLDQGQWTPTELERIFATQLGIHESNGAQIHMHGPTVKISPNDALTIGLAVHELTSNAARYGALSTSAGCLEITWRIIEDSWVQVDWQESGGPPATKPDRLGFGLTLVQRALAHELQRPIEFEFEPAGFHCRFFVHLREAKSFKLRN